MENKRFEHIITRYLKGKATPEEEAELLQAIHASKEWEAAFRKRTAEWNPLEETEADPETDRKWNRIASIITPSESQSQTEEAPVISLVSTSSRRIWFSIAAVVLLLLVSGVTVYFLNQGGKAGTGNAEWQTIIAAQEDRSILLPDGSSVYLRENSELSYPEVFASSVREVKIKGEAFFEVTPNSEQPFIVDASGLSVKVLGTSFSVQTSDQGNEISEILVEGTASLNNAHEKELVQWHPNQTIEKRLLCAAEADLTIVLYNPASHGRPEHLHRACGILLRVLPEDRLCGIVRCIGREGESRRVLTLGELKTAQADMFCTVFIGNAAAQAVGGNFITPRGYRDV